MKNILSNQRLFPYPMKNLKKICIINLFILVNLLAGCARPEPPLRIGTNQWVGYEPLYLARDLGYLDDTPVRLAEYLSTSDVMNALRNESIEAAAITLDEALILLSEGFDLKIILIFDYSVGADALVARPGIRDIKGLKGKKIGTEGMASGAYILSRALEAGGLGPSDVKIVPVSAGEQEKAFKEGSVDAVITFEPAMTRIMEAGGKKIFDSRMIPGEILDVLAVRADVLKKQHNTARDIIKNWFRAIDYLKKNQKDASERMARRSHVTGEQYIKSLEGLYFPGFAENNALLVSEAPGILATAQRLINIMLDNGFIKKNVDPAAIIDAAPLMRGRP